MILIKMCIRDRSKPAAPEIMMAGVTQPTIMATTCWSASGSAWESSGMPSISNKDARCL